MVGEYQCNRDLHFGTDPEIFVENGNGEIIPSWKFLPPKEGAGFISQQAEDLNSKVFTDGFQAECTTYSPMCLQLLVFSTRLGLKQISNAARTFDPTARLTYKNTPQVERGHLEKEDIKHVMLGCSPSRNVYGLIGEFPGNPRKLKHRFAGGHMHMSGFAIKDKERLVKALDKIVGIYFVAASEGIDDPVRRKYYGQAGEYRLPEWGLEYRTLSNSWLIHPAVQHLAFNLARGVVDLVQYDLDKEIPFGDELTIETINNCDVRMARNMVKANAPLFQAIFMNGIRYFVYRNEQSNVIAQVKGLFALAEKGILNVIPDVDNFEKNWNLQQEGSDEWPVDSTHEWRRLCPVLFPVKVQVSVPAIAHL